MKSKLLYILVFVLGASNLVNGQLNDYKYIIVPKRFEGFKSQNQYQTSTIVKHLFTKKGFTAVYDDALPEDLANNRCLGLTASLVDESPMFSTKVSVALIDCQAKEVYRTMQGVSRIKEYLPAYREALEKAFVSLDGMDYKYVPKKDGLKEEVQEKPITVSYRNDVQNLDEPVQTKVVQQEATPENQSYKSLEPKPSDMVKAEEKVKAEPLASEVLYAQPTANGYQLVDSTPKVVLKLEETSIENVFLTDYAGNAVVFQKDGKWFLEYSENGEKKLKELNIKF
ncbi:hypothetical protein F8C76_09005 [Flagellimonas olearia]|uniref:Uncharacterized protein n=1 Tax=Flagellimonas olearia TaxID=552546 RepID=A0A6I1ECX5_9FLAO|nr:hypothetical protein [Allomuricauda olearia]KAB7531614.1 hypothetical protein F8C76_09005 [Allomuricauda olearia]